MISMMNNPSFPHHGGMSHGYGQSMDGNGMAHFSSDLNQMQNQFQQPSQFSQAGTPTPNRPQQFQGQIPPHLQQQYQQFQQQQQQHLLQQQQQQQQQQHLQQQQAQAGAQFARPQSRDNFGLVQGQGARQSPTGQHNRSQSTVSQGNAPNTPSAQRQNSGNMQGTMGNMNNMGMGMAMHTMQASPSGPQMAQTMNAMQAVRAPIQQQAQQQASPVSPQTAAREEERVSTLLEINAHLILEVSNLQAQGKGPTAQQTPTSPTTNDPTPNSPQDASKKPHSQEYADCMRRLQANLAYLAAIADSSKKTAAPKPIGPAIMIPPSHLTSVHGLYQKLKTLFPEASQTTLNKAMAVANAQAARAAANPAQGQSQHGQIG